MTTSILDNLPESLNYLKEPAMKYGVHQFVGDVDKFLQSATEEEMAELSRIAEQVLASNHYPDVLKFIKQYSIVDHQDSACLYFLFGVLDYAGLKFS